MVDSALTFVLNFAKNRKMQPTVVTCTDWTLTLSMVTA